MRGSRSEKVKMIFQQFDANHDGGLNKEEIKALGSEMNKSMAFSTSSSMATRV